MKISTNYLLSKTEILSVGRGRSFTLILMQGRYACIDNTGKVIFTIDSSPHNSSVDIRDDGEFDLHLIDNSGNSLVQPCLAYTRLNSYLIYHEDNL